MAVGTRPLSTSAVNDESVREIVGRDGDRNPITGNDLDVKAAQPAADAGKERVSLVSLHPKVAASERLDHPALNLNQVISCHKAPFCRARFLCLHLLDSRCSDHASQPSRGDGAGRAAGRYVEPSLARRPQLVDMWNPRRARPTFLDA